MCGVCCVMWPRFKCSNFHSWFIRTLHENELLSAVNEENAFTKKNLTRVTGLLYHHYWTWEHCWSHRQCVSSLKLQSARKSTAECTGRLIWAPDYCYLLHLLCWWEGGGREEGGTVEDHAEPRRPQPGVRLCHEWVSVVERPAPGLQLIYRGQRTARLLWASNGRICEASYN